MNGEEEAPSAVAKRFGRLYRKAVQLRAEAGLDDRATPSHPDVIAFAEALARAHAVRDIHAARKDPARAHSHLRPIL